jgi:hypothetical protein
VADLLRSDTGLKALSIRLGFVAAIVLLVIIAALGLRKPLSSLNALDRTSSAASSSEGGHSASKQGVAQSSSDAASLNAVAKRPNDAADMMAAAKLTIPAPPGTESNLQEVDPRTLRAMFERGRAMMQSNLDEVTTTAGARLINVAAALGYEPARALITREYPRDPSMRSTVQSVEAIRYSLDPLFISGEQGEARRPFLVLLASYFSGRRSLEAYASDLMLVLRDDGRLQTEDRVESLLGLLAHVRGACRALTLVVVKARTVTGPECFSGLKLQIENYLRVNKELGLERESRRQALRLLDQEAMVMVPR